MKLSVLLIFVVLPWIALVGDWALRWTEGSEALQITFVMFVFPLIMNALQYYIVDSFIKDKTGGQHDAVPSEDPEDFESRQPLQGSNSYERDGDSSPRHSEDPETAKACPDIATTVVQGKRGDVDEAHTADQPKSRGDT